MTEDKLKHDRKPQPQNSNRQSFAGPLSSPSLSRIYPRHQKNCQDNHHSLVNVSAIVTELSCNDGITEITVCNRNDRDNHPEHDS